jgi:hypothetical protein
VSVTIELILLGLVTAVRPAGVAAVYALVTAPAPRRLMSAYVIAGLAFTVTFGLIVILAFKGAHIRAGTSRTTAIAEIIGGALALAGGTLVLTGRIRGPAKHDAPKPSGRWASALDRHLTTRTAAIAGPATHIPGLFYLIALDLIVAGQPHVLEATVLLLIYNAVWFALAIIALVLCIANPATARRAVEALQTSARRHARTIILVIWFGAGILLLVRGLTAI